MRGRGFDSRRLHSRAFPEWERAATEEFQNFGWWPVVHLGAVGEESEVEMERVEEELGDVLIYALLACHRMGIDPAEAIRAKLRKSEEKCRVILAQGRPAKYDRL